MGLLEKIIRKITYSYKSKIKKCNIKSWVNIDVVEEYVQIEGDSYISEEIESIGSGTYINKQCKIENCTDIGRYCSIAQGVMIGPGSHPKEWVSTSPIFYSKRRGLVDEDYYINTKMDQKCVIGNDVWIGCRAIIMPGVKIGNGAIIGAASVVTKDVPSYSIVVGIPATVIGYRFEKDIINKLNNSEWWNEDLDVLKRKVNVMKNPNMFIKEI